MSFQPSQYDLERLIEASLIEWFARSQVHGITLTVPVRFEEEDNEAGQVTLPVIVMQAQREAEDPMPSTGVWRCVVTAKLDVQADDTDTDGLSADWSNLIALLTWDDLAAEMSRLDGLHVYGVRFPSGSIRTRQDRHWHYEIAFNVWAMTMNLDTDVIYSSSSSSLGSSSSSSES